MNDLKLFPFHTFVADLLPAGSDNLLVNHLILVMPKHRCGAVQGESMLIFDPPLPALFTVEITQINLALWKYRLIKQGLKILPANHLL